jgi:hypothetical protein
MIGHILRSSDWTHVANTLGDKMEWLVLLSPGNIDLTMRSNPPQLGGILLSHFPVPSKYHCKGHQPSSLPNEEQLHDHNVLRKVVEYMCHYFAILFMAGKLRLYADSPMWQYHPDVCAGFADYFGKGIRPCMAS